MVVTGANCKFKLKETTRLRDLKGEDDNDSLLYSAWNAMLNKSTTEENEYLDKLGIRGSNLPIAPHLENCKMKTQLYSHLDKRKGNESFPPWTNWKGFLHTFPIPPSEYIQNPMHEEANPPWVRSFTKKLQIFLSA